MTEESELKTEAKKILSLAGFYHVPLSAGAFSVKGLPDRCAIRNGEVFMFEFKSKKGEQSDHQKLFEMYWKGHGGNYYVIRTLDELCDIIGLKEKEV